MRHLPLRQFYQHISLTKRFVHALDNPRDFELCNHSFVVIVLSRIFGILAAYEDQNDHDALRHDPVLKFIADRSPDAEPLASPPTMSGFENAIASLQRLRDQFIDLFIASFTTPPKHLTVEIDAGDYLAPGNQQLVLFHGYFDQIQYFPSFITSADNNQTVVLAFRPGAVHAAWGLTTIFGASPHLVFLALSRQSSL